MLSVALTNMCKVNMECNVVSCVFQDMIEKLYTNPRKIFGLPEKPDTYIEVDMKTPWTIPPAMISPRPSGCPLLAALSLAASVGWCYIARWHT